MRNIIFKSEAQQAFQALAGIAAFNVSPSISFSRRTRAEVEQRSPEENA